MRLRARFSIPAVLARLDDDKAIALVAAVNGGAAILMLAALAWLVDLPLLFPALGPSAFILFTSPFSRAAEPRSVVLSHFAGISVGLAACVLVGWMAGRPVSLQVGGWTVIASASIAMAAIGTLLVRLDTPHPPACASALIVAVGAADGWMPILAMALGVLLLVGQAVAIHRLAGIRTPIWSRNSPARS
jgi:CBS-domain-containing membrane protein